MGIYVAIKDPFATEFLTSRFDSHVFGQQGKKEYGFDNIKVTNSAWDTNVVAASTVSLFSRIS